MPNNLSDGDIELIAERAAEKAVDRVYTQIGKSVAHKVIWGIGVAAVGMFLIFTGSSSILGR
tara:strand:+ start:598 stop:783 length:186 start_codon:yes stop_codon:yes gene_type:complete